jgi:Uncharacterized protein SCO1/SenC/PrrC, involved in biogenesis of respiratory and photosynthetic systems
MTGFLRTTLLLGGASLVLAAPASAHAATGDLANRAQYEQRLSESLSSGSVFRDETGRTIRVSDYYGGAPIVLVFAWFGCTTLCPTVVGNLARALSRSGLAPDEYTVVVASIDARDSPADASRMKRIWLEHAALAEAQRWHLLTGTEPAVTALAQRAVSITTTTRRATSTRIRRASSSSRRQERSRAISSASDSRPSSSVQRSPRPPPNASHRRSSDCSSSASIFLPPAATATR